MDVPNSISGVKNVTEYLTEFENYPWTEFLLKYYDIERGIVRDSVILLASLLNRAGYTCKSSIFAGQNHHFELHHQFLEHNRTLLFELRSLQHPVKVFTFTSSVEEIGVIREVILLTPDFLAPQAGALLEKIHAQFLAAYLCLERAFLRCGAELAEDVFKRLYDILNTALQLEGRPDLVGRAWFFGGTYAGILFR